MSLEKRDGIVTLIGDSKIQKAITVEVRDNHGTRIICGISAGADGDRRTGSLRKESISFASGSVDAPQQNRNIIRSGIYKNYVRGLAGCESAVVAENSGANGDLASFVGAKRDRRWSHLSEVSVVLILQDGKGVGAGVVGIEEIFKNHSQIGERAAGEVICYQRGGIHPYEDVGLRKNRGSRQPSQCAGVPNAPGEHSESDWITRGDKEAGRFSGLRGREGLPSTLHRREAIGGSGSAARKGEQTGGRSATNGEN